MRLYLVELEQTPCLICGSENAEEVYTTKAMMYDEESPMFSFVRCNNCSLVYLNERPTKESIARFYPNYYLPYRSEKAWGKWHFLAAIGSHSERNKRVKWVLNHKRNPKRILDLGCGKPTFLNAIKQKTKADCTGIDFVKAGWDAQEHKNIHFIEGDPSQWNWADEQPFDVLTMWHYLEHDYHPLQTLKKLKQASHQESLLFIEVPNYDSAMRKQQGRFWQGFHTPRHTACYTPKTLTRLVEDAGWQVVESRPYGSLDSFALYWMGEYEKSGKKWDTSLEREMPSFLMKRAAFRIRALLGRSLGGVQQMVVRPA